MEKDKTNLKNEELSKVVEKTLSSIKEIADGSGIVGKPIKVSSEITIIPLNKISVGYVIGGGNIASKKAEDMDLNGTTTGFNISPLGFISIINNNVSFVSINQVYPYKKILDLLDKALDNLNKKEYYANEKDN